MVALCAKGSRHTVTDGTNVSIEVIRNALMSPRVRPWHISALKPHLCLNCQKEESVLSNCLEALDVSHLCGNHRHPDNGLRLGRGGLGIGPVVRPQFSEVEIASWGGHQSYVKIIAPKVIVGPSLPLSHPGPWESNLHHISTFIKERKLAYPTTAHP